jgi:hypothetical protein
MKTVINVFLFVVFCSFCNLASGASFYIVAHPDDIELFMARNAAYDIIAGAKVVFLVVTAGDLVPGRSSGWVPFPDMGTEDPDDEDSYPAAREAGHHDALLSLYSLRGLPAQAQLEKYISIAGKVVRRTLIGSPTSNVVMYVLRLPEGYSTTIQTASVTGIGPAPTATFSFGELKSFINALIDFERDDGDSWVNLQDTTASASEDHPEHITTAQFMKQALDDYAASNPTHCVRSIEWRGYTTTSRPVNYSSDEQFWQLDAWNTLNDTMVRHHGPDTRDRDHSEFLYRIYDNGIAQAAYGPCE